MRRATPLLTLLLCGIGYFLCAELAGALAQFDNGVAILWPANALLAAIMSVRPRRQWPAFLILCGMEIVAGQAVEGDGWKAGTAMALAHLSEATLAAALMRRFLSRSHQIGSLRWLVGLLFGVSVAAPLAGSTLAVAGLRLVGNGHWDLPHVWGNWYSGHALGLIIFLPCFTALAHSQQRPQLFRSGSQQWLTALLFPAAMAVVASVTFGHEAHPLLFMPILVLVSSLVFVELVTLTVMYVILAVVGLWFVRSGHSPMNLMAINRTTQFQFFQIFLAATALGIMPVAAAVQQMRRLLVRLRESEARYRLLADNSTDIILSTAPDGTIRFASASMLQLGQHQPRALAGRPALSLVSPRNRRSVLEAYGRALQARGETVQVEFLGLPALSAPRWCEAHMRAVLDYRGEVECVVSVVRDMAERKEYETALALAALTDELTGLPNRRMFMEAMQDCIARGKSGCVALIDLDHFKQVNDSFGHQAGDEVLRNFARVARQGLRGSDTLARIGGEEFALLLPGAPLEVGERICARLGAALAATVTHFDGVDITITSSIGLTRVGRDPESAMAAADQALYCAKDAGRARLSIAA